MEAESPTMNRRIRVVERLLDRYLYVTSLAFEALFEEMPTRPSSSRGRSPSRRSRRTQSRTAGCWSP